MAAIPSADTSSFDAIAIGASSSSVPIAAAKATAASLEVKKNPCGGRHHMSRPLRVKYQIRSVRMDTKSGSSASDDMIARVYRLGRERAVERLAVARRRHGQALGA